MSGWALAGVLLALSAGLERRARRRAELVARACHELRGPLTAAGLALHAAGRRHEVPARRIAAVALQLRRAELALGDLARAPRGLRVADARGPVAVADLLAREAAAWAEIAFAHGCDVRLSTPLPAAVVRADAGRLSQAAGNLIANALEHGARVVWLGARVDRGTVCIEVADDGPGLPAAVGVLASRPRAGRGAHGRGLAIAADVAARHGGDLTSVPSADGARLVLELPAVVPHR